MFFLQDKHLKEEKQRQRKQEVGGILVVAVCVPWAPSSEPCAFLISLAVPNPCQGKKKKFICFVLFLFK